MPEEVKHGAYWLVKLPDASTLTKMKVTSIGKGYYGFNGRESGYGSSTPDYEVFYKKEDVEMVERVH